jgi:hypothetical protein
MSNKDILVKKILNEINLGYSKPNKKLLLENKCEKPPNGQTALSTMNQIMQFQEYVWDTIEKDLPKIKGSCNGDGKDCSYDSILCSVKPCKRKNAVDGLYGGGTKTAWSKYGAQYKQKNSCWWVHDGETGAKLIGQEIPTTMKQTKNFQRWYWTQFEKLPDNDNQKKNSELCAKPCTYTEAVDGIFGLSGSRTSNLWQAWGKNYQNANPEWYAEKIWDKKTAEDETKQEWIRKNFIFTDDNPSGYNGYSPVPNIFDWLKKNAQVLFKPTKEAAEVVKLPNYGWDINKTLFPTPKKYSASEFTNFYPVEEQQAVAKIEQNYLALQYTPPNMKSDRLGKGGTFETQQRAIGGTSTQKTDYDQYLEALSKTKNPHVKSAEAWNSRMDNVGTQITSKCSRPMKFWFNGFNNKPGEERWLSYYDVCKYAGGLWTYIQGSQPICGCRYMSDKNGLVDFGGGNTRGDATIVIKGTDGDFKAADFDWKSLSFELSFQTKGGQQDQIYGDGELDIHDIMTIAEIGTLIAAVVATGGLATILFATSALIGITDSLIYFKEGDPYMGTMMLAINLVGGLDEIVSVVKWGQGIAKTWTKETLEIIAKKKVAKQILDAAEKKILSEVQQFVYKNQTEIVAKMQWKMSYNFVTDGLLTTAKKNKWGWDVFFNSVIKLAKMVGKSTIGGLVIKIGGAAVTADQLYLLMNGNDEQRKNAGLGKLMDMLYSGLGLSNEQKQEKLKQENATTAWKAMQEDIKQNASEYMSSEVTAQLVKFDPTAGYSKEENESWAMQQNQIRSTKPDPTQAKKQVQSSKILKAPSISEIKLEGRIIEVGMSGDSVSQITNLLKLRGINDITNPSLYDGLTAYYIYEFQDEYKLTPTGNVDAETYNWLTGDANNRQCDQIDKLKTEGWIQINDMMRNAKIAANQKDKIIELKCKGNQDPIYLYNKNYTGPSSSGKEFFGKPENQNSGIPKQYSMLDNPQNENSDLQEQLLRIKEIMR